MEGALIDIRPDLSQATLFVLSLEARGLSVQVCKTAELCERDAEAAGLLATGFVSAAETLIRDVQGQREDRVPEVPNHPLNALSSSLFFHLHMGEDRAQALRLSVTRTYAHLLEFAGGEVSRGRSSMLRYTSGFCESIVTFSFPLVRGVDRSPR